MKHRIPPNLANFLAAARTGSRSALGRALDACRPYLLHIANEELELKFQPRGGASDLVAETVLRGWRHFDQFEGGSTEEFHAWLRRILINLVEDFRRRHTAARRDVDREVSLDTSDSSFKIREILICDTPGIDAKAVGREALAALGETLARLPVRYREVLRLRHEERLSFEAAGAALGCSADAARMLHGRAVARLQREMGEHA